MPAAGPRGAEEHGSQIPKLLMLGAGRDIASGDEKTSQRLGSGATARLASTPVGTWTTGRTRSGETEDQTRGVALTSASAGRSQPVEAIAQAVAARRSVRGRPSQVKGACGVARDDAARHP